MGGGQIASFAQKKKKSRYSLAQCNPSDIFLFLDGVVSQSMMEIQSSLR